jgi:hypothetical protein
MLRYAIPYLLEGWKDEAKATANLLLVVGGAAVVGRLIATGQFTITSGGLMPSEISQLAGQMRGISAELWNGLRSANGIELMAAQFGNALVALSRVNMAGHEVSLLARGIQMGLMIFFYLGPTALEADRRFRRGFGAESGQAVGAENLRPDTAPRSVEARGYPPTA